MRLALATLALIGLATAAQPLTPKLHPEITLKGGEARVIPDTGVTLLLTKVDDARCPPDVECYWEGMIRAEITVLTTKPELMQVVLCNMCDDGQGLVTVAGLTIGLVGLAPSTAELADPLLLSVALGLVLTFLLTVPVAGTMSSGTGHLVGTPVTGARFPLMGWSTEVGDLRLPHFLATHAMHFVPLAGLTGSRGAVWAAAAGFTALTLWCFARALMGLPPF